MNCTESETLFGDVHGLQRDGHLSGKSYSVERFVLSKRYPNVKILNYFHVRDFFADARPTTLLVDTARREATLQML